MGQNGLFAGDFAALREAKPLIPLKTCARPENNMGQYVLLWAFVGFFLNYS